LDGRILKRHSEKLNAISISRRHSHAHPPKNKNVVYRTNELISGGSLALPLRWILSAV